MGRRCSRGEIKYAHKIVTRKSERRRPTGSPRHRWEDYLLKGILIIKMSERALDSTGSG